MSRRRTCLLMLGLTWWRPSYAGWRGWACGNAGVVLGMLIGALRTPDTRLTSVLLGNGLVLLGSALLLLAGQAMPAAQWLSVTSESPGERNLH